MLNFNITTGPNSTTEESGFTALDTDLFMHMVLYTGSNCKSEVFDSGYTLAVTPFSSNFEETITPVKNYMNGLGTTDKVNGEGTIV